MVASSFLEDRRGDKATHQCPLGAAACSSRVLLTRALLLTSSRSKVQVPRPLPPPPKRQPLSSHQHRPLNWMCCLVWVQQPKPGVAAVAAAVAAMVLPLLLAWRLPRMSWCTQRMQCRPGPQTYCRPVLTTLSHPFLPRICSRALIWGAMSLLEPVWRV